MRPGPHWLTGAALLGVAAATGTAQQPAPAFDLSVRSIMRGPEVHGREPQRPRFTADSRWIYFSWLPPGTDWRETLKPYRVRAQAGAVPERVTDVHMDSVGPSLEAGRLAPDRLRRVVSYNGDLFLIDQKTATLRRLTETVVDERDPHFSVDGKRIYFIRDGLNVMSLDLDAPLVRQLTDIRAGPAPAPPERPSGQRAALEAQQKELFEAVRDRVRQDSIARATREARDAMRTKTLYLGQNERVTALSVSPTGRALLLTTTITTAGARQTIVPSWVTLSGYTEDLSVRTKVGDAQAGGRVAFMELPAGTLRWLGPIPRDSTETPSITAALGWNDAGTEALLLAERKDFKERYLLRIDADGGRLTTIDVLRDSAWVGGPCYPCGGFLPGTNRVWFVSEADGYAHLYTMHADGSDRQQLTRGAWEVLDARISDDRRFFELHTSEVSPYERQFYRLPIAGGPAQRLTTQVGGHTVVVSPDGQLLADVFSTANRPPELFVGPARPGGAPGAQLTVSPTTDWLAHPWLQPEIITIPASDGVAVPARIYRPADVGARPNGAGVIFVHGAGYLHNVHNYWSSYSREFMFNHLLASKGYFVLDIDYRASAGYGRDWRTAIYRWMGGRDLQDQVDGSRYLRNRFGIPPERVGIYGGSYGGFITLMALFTAPGEFGAGAALRSVTDWAHYNHGYTGRILNLPQTDTLAYRRSSPIFFAEGLEDPLLMAHGMVDTNVHYQDIVRLTQRLIELGKTRWELASYPVENHGFVTPSSWTDEYRRILELFEANLPVRPGAAGGNER
jgi:dipeptidyl aminopeptidase/acylaminoacyl peptidase